MSHTLFHHSMLCNALVWAWLHEVDEAEAARCREAGCGHCPGKLHSARYPRKPYGLAAELRDAGTRRFSFCCADCRLRATPASVRFFGRRFYLGALFVLVSALMLRGGVRLQTIKRRWGIPIATLRRWRQWWRGGVPGDGALAGEAGRAGDAVRGGAAALCAAADAGRTLRRPGVLTSPSRAAPCPGRRKTSIPSKFVPDLKPAS